MKKNASEAIPSLQFYPADWLGDINLRMCSDATRGAWIDLLCIMHKSKKYGFLVQKVDKKWTNLSPKMIQKLTGMSPKKVQKYIQELLRNNVLKLDENGLMFSKRLVKDQRLREIRKEAGKLGGNPILLNQEVNPLSEKKDPPSSSSSSSSSISSSLDTPPIPPTEKNNLCEKHGEYKTDECKKCLREDNFEKMFWPAYPLRKGRRNGKQAALKLFFKIPENEIDKVLIGERNYGIYCRETDTYPKDADTWLRNKLWDEWQQPHIPEKKLTANERALMEYRRKKEMGELGDEED